MACFHPLDAWQLGDGTVVFVECIDAVKSLQLPCRQCIGCKLERSRQWAVRVVHEAQLHEFNVFITLTYDDANLGSVSLVYRDFQLFMKKLRKRKGYFDVTLWQWLPRFYMCGEYGDNFGRPHFHACLFGCFFPDRQLLKRLPSGHSIFTSEELSQIWTLGFSSIGDVTFESAAYVARYCMKKITGKNSASHYEAVDGRTGEIIQRTPEFNKMSLKPGIAGGWFRLFRDEVFSNDYVVLNGLKLKPPRYYDVLLARVDEHMATVVKETREAKAMVLADDSTPERLKVREQVTRARLAFKPRGLQQ